MSMRMLLRGFVLAPLLAACAEGGANGRWAGTVETLAGGRVRVTNPAQGVWRPGEGWRLTRQLVLGEADGDEATVFAAISGIEADDEGRIYVLDRQANQLRIFTADGRHVRTVGRSGEGPGEYRAANGLLWLAPDSLLVVDQRGNRYSVLTREGEYVRSVTRRLPFYGWVYSGGLENDRIYENFSVGDDTDRKPVLLGTALRGPAGGLEAAATGVAAPPVSTTATVDTVFLPQLTGPLYSAFSVQTATGGMVMSVPFAPAPHYYLDGAGNLWLGHGNEFRLLRQTLAGDTSLEIVLRAQPAPVTEAEVAEWDSTAGPRRFRERGGKIDLSRIPKTKPFFDDMLVAADGNLWVSVPAAPAQSAFAVFDAEGRFLGRLEVSGFERDTFLRPVVRKDRLYLVGRDELDVQRVYVFAIEK